MATKKSNKVIVKAYPGDAMALLAFSVDERLLNNFTGFSIRVIYKDPQQGNFDYFILNKLSYDLKKVSISNPQKNNILSSEYSPIQKFNWIYVPATYHHVKTPYYGVYEFEVTPRYLKDNTLLPLDKNLTCEVKVLIRPFEKEKFRLAFTRGFVASQAYVNHFGINNKVRPDETTLLFDIKQNSGPDAKEQDMNIRPYTYEEQFAWMGWQARQRIYELLEETISDKNLSLAVFAYDLDEPFICGKLLELGRQNRTRIILDNASLHTGKDKKGNPQFEDVFEQKFRKLFENPDDKIFRGRFSRFSHHKVLIQSRNGKPCKVLTGSTNFSTNGLYVNANHVLIFDHPDVAALYQNVFDACFGKEQMKTFKKNDLAKLTYDFTGKKGLPDMTIRFSPHSEKFAAAEIKQLAKRIKSAGSDVLFAVMNDTTGSGDLLKTIREIHKRSDIFSYGIVDKSKDVTLYKPGSPKGIRVAGNGPVKRLPPPFVEEDGIKGISIHHKFVVVDFKGKNPVVYCGSSNLAETGEKVNGDNLLEIRDRDIVTAFAIEAMRLVDHYHFRNREQKKDQMFLFTFPWYKLHYDTNDLRCVERELLIKDNPA